MAKLPMSTSGGIRPRCSCKSGCWTRQTCRWSGSNRPSSCCASHKDAKISRQLHNRFRREVFRTVLLPNILDCSGRITGKPEVSWNRGRYFRTADNPPTTRNSMVRGGSPIHCGQSLLAFLFQNQVRNRDSSPSPVKRKKASTFGDFVCVRGRAFPPSVVALAQGFLPPVFNT